MAPRGVGEVVALVVLSFMRAGLAPGTPTLLIWHIFVMPAWLEK
jgi:hypothetical protein